MADEVKNPNLRDDPEPTPPPAPINTDIHEELQKASEVRTGEKVNQQIDYQGIVNSATNWNFERKEQWAKELTVRRIKTYYTDASYTVKDNDVFFEDSERFGAITQIISMEMPDIIANRSWTQITSGTTTIGSNVAYLPIVSEKLVGGTSAWELPVCFTGVQLDSAFNSASELRQFDNYVNLVAQNAISYHKQTLAGINRNNYMAEKIYAQFHGATNKCHAVNLVEEYCKQYGITAGKTVADYLADEKCLRHAVKTFKKYKSLLKRMTTLFTTKSDSKGKFIPEDRFVFQVISDFEGMLESTIYGSTYHNEFVKMPLYRDVASWQALDSATATADFGMLTALDVVTSEGHTVSTNPPYNFYPVALMVDKWAIMHTMVQNRVGYQRDDIKDITMFAHQFTDRYINNLELNGCVFYLADVSASE